MNFTPQEVGLDVWHVDDNGRIVNTVEDGMNVRYGFSYNRVVAITRLGPWTRAGNFRVRPYIVAGPGWYMINQSAEIKLSNWSDAWHYLDRTDSYLGALVGMGLSVAIGESSSIPAESRYERVFSPGPTLQFFVPSLQFSYHF